jgi:hypothetical protein
MNRFNRRLPRGRLFGRCAFVITLARRLRPSCRWWVHMKEEIGLESHTVAPVSKVPDTDVLTKPPVHDFPAEADVKSGREGNHGDGSAHTSLRKKPPYMVFRHLLVVRIVAAGFTPPSPQPCMSRHNFRSTGLPTPTTRGWGDCADGPTSKQTTFRYADGGDIVALDTSEPTVASRVKYE